MRNVKVSKILRILADDGWYLDRQKGDHREFKHPTKKGVVTVNGKPSTSICEWLLSSVERQSELRF